MSEEEIIKECKRIIFEYGCIRKDTEGEKEDLQALEGLLDLYNKEKEEKEKFKKALGKRITYCNELEKDLFENCSNYVISKDKIKEKIKYYYDIDNIVGVRILENLMEENNK